MRIVNAITEKYRQKSNMQLFWKRLGRALAVLVCLLTMYALMLPAVTSEQFVTVNTGGDTIITISNVNYYVPDEVVLIDGYTVADFCDKSYTNISFQTGGGTHAMTPEAKASFEDNQPTFIDYTAVIIENLDNKQGTGVQYYVDAVISCTESTIMDPGITMTNLRPRTDNGFIVYIPTKFLTEANTPKRGDLVTPDFWHWDQNVIVGRNEDSGTLKLEDNPTTDAVMETVQGISLNATVKVFDYNATVNNLNNEFYFWNGDYGNGADIESVDGWGADMLLNADGNYEGAYPGHNITSDAYHGYNKKPIMTGVLSEYGYPQIEDQNPANRGNPLDLDYLFNHTYQKGATMHDGGGLFQLDENGYYYFDSGQNYAYFNGNRFVLYKNLVVRPWADSNDTSNQAYGNFLPLNPINKGNVLLDGYYFVDHTITSTGEISGKYGETWWLGSLQKDVQQSIYSALATLDNNGNNRLKQEVYNKLCQQGKFSARLEDQTNLWFGMSVEFAFYQPAGGKVNGEDMIFDFNGDDDVWVYVGIWNTQTMSYDYKLVLDIGGAHEARDGNINFATGAVAYINAQGELVNTSLKEIFDLEGDTFEDYSKLSLKFFYMERGGNISYCRLRFNIPTVPDKSLMVTKELQYDTEDEALEDYIAEAYPYHFRVVEADSGKILIKEGASFDIIENGVTVGTGTVGENGTFSLRAGQSALFENLLETYGNVNYVVQELISSPYAGQYSGVWYTIDGGTNTATNVDTSTSKNFHTYTSGVLNTSQSEYVVYRNQVNTDQLCTLMITKQKAAGATLPDEKFRIYVTIGGKPVPVGATFMVGGEEREVTTEGMIELAVGETAIIGAILSGTEYTVDEIVPDGSGYFPSYSGQTSGTFGLNETLEIVITNADFATTLEIPLSKTYIGNSGNASFDFIIEQVTQDGAHVAYLEGCTVTVSDDAPTAGTANIKFSTYTADGLYYYRVYEKTGLEDAAYDNAVYLVTVQISRDSGGKPIASIIAIEKNGEAFSGESLAFVNHKLTNVTITKTVTGNTPPPGVKFSFTAIITVDGNVYLPADSSGYTIVGDGTVTFELGVDETVTIRGVPVGATITVTEEELLYYLTSFTAGSVTTSDNTIMVTAPETGIAITCNNEGLYALPETGGIGTTAYTLAGAILVIFSSTCLLYIFHQRRREGT